MGSTGERRIGCKTQSGITLPMIKVLLSECLVNGSFACDSKVYFTVVVLFTMVVRVGYTVV